MAPKLEFNNGASFKMILMDQHNTKGNKIISRSKIFICKNNFYKTSQLHNMSNNFKKLQPMKILIPDRGLTVTGPVHTAALLVSLKILKTSSISTFQVTFLEAGS